MNRRNFLGTLAAASGGAVIANNIQASTDFNLYPELTKHKITEAKLLTIDYHWPRFVGKNGYRDVHGQHQKSTVLRLRTDQGAEGWGLSDPKASEQIERLNGKI